MRNYSVDLARLQLWSGESCLGHGTVSTWHYTNECYQPEDDQLSKIFRGCRSTVQHRPFTGCNSTDGVYHVDRRCHLFLTLNVTKCDIDLGSWTFLGITPPDKYPRSRPSAKGRPRRKTFVQSTRAFTLSQNSDTCSEGSLQDNLMVLKGQNECWLTSSFPSA